MVNIQTIDLSSRNVTLPSDRVGMVIAQPYLSLTPAEPFRCTSQAKTGQLAVLSETLSVARAAPHGASKTHFTIFPEYSIPGLDGVALIENTLRASTWPNGTIVIGGTDGLSKPDFESLASVQGTHLNASDNALNRVLQNEWVNCGVTWIKGADGTVERWLQPKLYPAWPEQNIHYQTMFRGNSVFIFKGPLENGTRYLFCLLVCFDWIATVAGQKIWRSVLEDLKQQATLAQAELSLSWFFVIQHNKKPSHDTFLIEVNGFFDQTSIPNVRRDRACLVFANSAGKPLPGGVCEYGSTGLVFSQQTLFTKPDCHPTFSNGGANFRSSTLLSAYQDVLFREGGACIHSFLQVNPNSLGAGAAGRTVPLVNPSVYPLPGCNSDPRTPSGPVPACVKWFNDILDDLPRLGDAYPAVTLANAVNVTHQQTIEALRTITPQSITHTVKLATAESNAKNADEWNHTEVEAIQHLVQTLNIVSLGLAPPAVGVDPAHATVVMNNQTVDLVAIRGETHESCIEHAKTVLAFPQRQLLLVSRDRDNNPWRQRLGSFLQPKRPQLGQERNITDPASGLLHLGYRKLLDVFQQSNRVEDIQGAINAELAA